MVAMCMLQVYDTITDAMYTSLSRVEQASGIPQTRQLSKWQHLLAGASLQFAACSMPTSHSLRVKWDIKGGMDAAVYAYIQGQQQRQACTRKAYTFHA